MRRVTLPNEELLPEVATLLSEGHRVTIRAKGNSMMPFIVGGRDSVVLQQKNSYQVGDIVLGEASPQKFVLHRVIRKDGERFTLMGDGNISGTEVCRAENIHGRALAIVYKGKHIDCNSKAEQRKARAWRTLLPVRRYLLAIYKRIT